MHWRRIFFTPQGVLRLPWRLLATTLTWLTLTLTLSTLLVVVLVLTRAAGWLPTQPGALPAGLFALLAVVAALATVGTLALAQRLWEPLTWDHWGLRLPRAAGRDLLLGFAAGLFMQAAVAVALYLTGSATWRASLSTTPPAVLAGSVVLWLLVFAVVAWYEEALLRGYLYTTLAHGLGPWVGAGLSAVVFGLLHADNPAFGPRAFLGIALVGLFFVLIRRPTPWGLALPVGVHWGWNFAEGVLFGFPVSGLPVPALAQADLTGPAWWTGGAFGPEAGAVVLVALAVGWVLLRPRLAPPAPIPHEKEAA